MTTFKHSTAIAFIFILTLFTSCEFLEENIDADSPPDIAEGLKAALRVGTDSATARLASVDGYLKDEAVKILLPDELEEQIAKFKAITIDVGFVSFTGEQIYSTGIPILGVNGLQSVEDDLIMGVNRAAESAAQEAGPIFFTAITNITIANAIDILYGENDAATAYLKDNTFDALITTYEPKIEAAISSVKIGDQSVEEAYAGFVAKYNAILNTNIPLKSQSIAEIANLSLVEEADLSTFATTKGLDGLFLKIQNEEAQIRENPLNRVSEILQDVFGLLD